MVVIIKPPTLHITLKTIITAKTTATTTTTITTLNENETIHIEAIETIAQNQIQPTTKTH